MYGSSSSIVVSLLTPFARRVISRTRCLKRSFSADPEAAARKIFCERLPRVARAYGRQTERTSEIVRLIGYVAGGLPGQRLLARLAIATSDDTVLRRIRRKPAETVAQYATWESTIGPGVKAKTTERFWLIWTSTA